MKRNPQFNLLKEPGYQIRRLEKILKHPNFGNPKKYDNDITLLITETPFDYSASVRPACLPGEKVAMSIFINY